ncbi:MAG: TRAP transporter substrate-binding protein [Methyloligellaceae bacterium]
MKIRKFVAMAATAALFAVMLHGPASAAEITLKLGTVANDTTSLGKGIAEVLIPKVKEYSKGRMEIQAHWMGSICGEQICGEQARQGLIDIATSSTANFGNFGTSYAIADLPYIFKDLKSANKLAAGWFGKALHEKAVKETGFRVYGVFSVGGFRALGNNVRPIKVPKDLEGIKIRVTKSPVEFTLIKSWGGVPIPYDWVQLYQGLQTGVVNGQYVQLPWQELYKMYEVQQHYTVMGGAWGANVIYMDDARVKKLPDWAQEALQKAMDEMVLAVMAADEDWVDEGTKKIKAKVKTFYYPNDEEKAKWIAGAVQAWKKAKGTYDAKLAKRALEEQGLGDFVKRLEKEGAL